MKSWTVIVLSALWLGACASSPESCRDVCAARETCPQEGCVDSCAAERTTEQALGCATERSAYESCMVTNSTVCGADALYDACVVEVRELSSCQARFCESNPMSPECAAGCVANCQSQAADCETPPAILARCEMACVTDLAFVSRAGCSEAYFFLERCTAAHQGLCSMGALTDACGLRFEALSSCYMTYCSAFPDDEDCGA